MVDRISHLRRMIEDGEKSDLRSKNFVSHTLWHVAGARNLAKGGTPDKSFAERVFSGAKIRVEDAIEQGDKVTVRWRLHGTWTHDVAGLKATGKPIEVTGINIYRFVGDKIVEEHGQIDMASFVNQAIGGGVDPQACAKTLQELGRPPEASLPGVAPA